MGILLGLGFLCVYPHWLPFPVECFGGWEKGEPGEARGGAGRGRARQGRQGKGNTIK